MDQLVSELRESYVTNPVLFNVTHYQPEGSSTVKIEQHWIAADPSDDSYIKTSSMCSYDTDSGKFENGLNVTVEQDTVYLQAYSPSGLYKVSIKMTMEGAIIEVFKLGKLIIRKPVAPTAHLLPCRTNVLMSEFVIFSKDEKRFMYMADDPVPLISVYKLKELGLNRFKYQDSLGDKLSSHSNPSIFIFDIELKDLFKVSKPI